MPISDLSDDELLNLYNNQGQNDISSLSDEELLNMV